jgi:hypothetical protein
VELTRGLLVTGAGGQLAEALQAGPYVESDARAAIAPAKLGRRAPRPAYSVLRSERTHAPQLPHRREGLRACLERLG